MFNSPSTIPLNSDSNLVTVSVRRGDALLIIFSSNKHDSNCRGGVHWPQNKSFREYLPQNGIPSGIHWPLSQTRRVGPSNSNPRSHEYDATAPFDRLSSVN